MTPDGVHGDERRAVLHEPADVDRMKAVDVLVGSDRVEHAALGVRRPSPPAAATARGCRRARRSGSGDRRARAARRATRSPAAARGRRAARLRRPTSACCGRRSPTPDRRRRARCRAGRTPGLPDERRDRGRDLGADLIARRQRRRGAWPSQPRGSAHDGAERSRAGCGCGRTRSRTRGRSPARRASRSQFVQPSP